jgi:acetyl-CoA synthetase
MGVLCADVHPPGELALIDVDAAARNRQAVYTFGDLKAISDRLANGLRSEIGVGFGDRVAILLPQCAETGLAHLAIYKLGAVALPLSGLFGAEALAYRLGDSGARVLITDRAHIDVATELSASLGLTVISVDAVERPHREFWSLVENGSRAFEAVHTAADTPALMIYTSGTTGSPKGALHGHRVLHGHLPGFDLSHNFFGEPGDRLWTPADWAWIGGLLDGLLPTWFHGCSVVASRRAKFDPDWAVSTMKSNDVRNVFLPPTVLKLMRQADVSTSGVRLRTIMCGGEPLGEELLTWTRDRLGVTINEIYGQTEANYLVGNCSDVWDVRPGSMGRPYPGHNVAILREDETIAESGEVGEVALRLPDPVAFLEYYGRPELTRAKFTADGAWLLTGDLGERDESGYLWYRARADDVINSAGYRIGPGEIEECLLSHPSVAMAAAVGVPDEVRGEVVKAFIVLSSGHTPSASLEAEIQDWVRRRLAAYLYPRHIEFVTDLPLTTSGKIRRTALRAQSRE